MATGRDGPASRVDRMEMEWLWLYVRGGAVTAGVVSIGLGRLTDANDDGILDMVVR